MTINLDDLHRLFTQRAKWSVENSFTVAVVDEIIGDLRQRILRKEIVGTICDLRDMISMFGLESMVSGTNASVGFPALRTYIEKLKSRGDDQAVCFHRTSMHIHSVTFSCLYSVISSRDDFESIEI